MPFVSVRFDSHKLTSTEVRPFLVDLGEILALELIENDHESYGADGVIIWTQTLSELDFQAWDIGVIVEMCDSENRRVKRKVVEQKVLEAVGRIRVNIRAFVLIKLADISFGEIAKVTS